MRSTGMVAIVAASLLAGCAVPFPVYTVSSSNVTSIRSAKAVVELGEFSGLQTSVSCRLQPISPEGNRTFAQYIRGALNDEVVIAGPSSSVRKSKLSLQLKNIDVDCAVGAASWMMEVDVSINGKPSFNVKTVRNFDGNFMGNVVAQRAYQAFVPSVQQLIADIMMHPNFKAEFGS